MTPLDLEAIRRRCEAATEGPWTWDADLGEVQAPHRHHGGCESLDDPPGGTSDCEGRPTVVVETDGGMYIRHKPDRDFIANARADIPSMLDVIDVLRRELLRLEWPRNGDKQPSGVRLRECPECLAKWPDWDDDGAVHAEDCELDAALNALGLDTADKRDAKRREMR